MGMHWHVWLFRDLLAAARACDGVGAGSSANDAVADAVVDVVGGGLEFVFVAPAFPPKKLKRKEAMKGARAQQD